MDDIKSTLRGQNMGFICYGQSGSGKSYTIFGDESEPVKGILHKTVNDIFKAVAEEGKDLDVNVSFFEIYMEQIRDLAANFQPKHSIFLTFSHFFIEMGSPKEEDKSRPGTGLRIGRNSTKVLEMLENLAGDGDIKNLNKIKIRNEADVNAVLKSGFSYRKMVEKTNPTISQRAHTIFLIKIEEPAIPGMESKTIGKIYFIELAGSERYGKGPKDNEKYKESMNIATDLKCLERAFLALPNEGVLPRETILIAAIRELLQQQNNISLIGHIISTSFEESLYTLQYVERCKGEVVGSEKAAEATGAGADQMLRNLRSLNEEYKKEIDNVEKKQEAQFDRIKVILGINLNLKTVLQRGATQSEKIIIDNYKQAKERVSNFINRNRELEEKLAKSKNAIEKIKMKIDDKTYYFDKLLSGMNSELNTLMSEATRLKSDYNSIPSEMSNNIEIERKEKAEEAYLKLDKHFGVLFSAQENLEKNNEAMIEATKVYENCKKDIERKYRDEMKHHKQTKYQELANLMAQYEYNIKKKKDELYEFEQDAKLYCKKKREFVENMKGEALKLRQTVEHQAQIIEFAEKGGFTQGILSINIPKNDKVSIPQTTIKKSALGLSKRCSSMTESTMKNYRSVSRPSTSQKMRSTISRPMTRCRRNYSQANI